MEPRLKQD